VRECVGVAFCPEITKNIEDALEQFITQLQADGRSPHTIRQYQRHVRALGAWVGPRRAVARVGHEDVATYLAATVARTRPDGGIRKASTMNAIRGSLKGFFGYLHEAGLVRQDPTRLLKRALCGKPPPRVLSEDDQRRLLEAVTHRRDRMLYRLLLGTGIRIGSALALDLADVDLARAELCLHCKGNREERVPVPRAVVEDLRAYVAGRPSGPLFTTKAGARLQHRQVHRRLGYWLKTAGIQRQASPHSLRHAFATGLYARTGDLLLVQRALRHRSIASTMVYAHLDDRRVREALEA
jgi:site-specific recombinase XerD